MDIRWRPLAKYIGNIPDRLTSDDIFVATSHFVPRTRARRAYFIYDTIKITHSAMMRSDGRKVLDILSRNIANSDMILVPSTNTKTDIDRYLAPTCPVLVAPHGLGHEWFGEERTSLDEIPASEEQVLSKLAKRPFFYSCGIVQERKRFGWVARVINECRLPQVFVISGALDSASKEMLAAMSRENPGVEILHLGFVSEVAKRWLYENCSLFCFPSIYEGFGMPVLEAMSRRAIVVAGDNSSIPDILRDEDQKFSTESFESFAETVTSLLGDTEQRTEARRAGNFAVANEFTAGAAARHIEHAVSMLLGRA